MRISSPRCDMPVTIIEHDDETRSGTDLKVHGLDRYTTDPEFKPLMKAYRIYNKGDHPGPVKQWVDGYGPLPAEVTEALLDPHVEKWGFNSQFERVVARRGYKIKTPYEGWRCTMVLGYMQSFVGGLDEMCMQLKIPQDKAKGAEGKRLINLFTKPQRITKKNSHIWRDEFTDPDDWELFLQYNRQDVVAEHSVREPLIRYPVPDDEWYLYEIDQRINDRGMPIDVAFVENAIEMSKHRKDYLRIVMQRLTGLDNPNSTQQLGPWLRERGYPFDDLRKDTVKKVLAENKIDIENARKQHIACGVTPEDLSDDPDEYGFMTSEGVKGLKLRQQAARTADRKYTSLMKAVGSDFRMRFCFQFGGASRTLRWAGRRFQPHNLTKTPANIEPDQKQADIIGVPKDYKLVEITNAIRDGDEELLELLIAEPLDALAGLVRSSVRAPDGYEIHAADLKSIESVGLGYLARCDRLLEVFRNGKDPYIDFATELYGKTYEDISKQERTNAKPATLGAGYRLGGGELYDGKKSGLWGYAEGMGIELSREEAHESVAVFRATYKEIPQFWYDLESAVAKTVTTGRPSKVGYVSFEYRKPYLCAVLPSGRRMYYYKPRIDKITMISPRTGNPYTKMQFSYMGKQQNGRKWLRVFSHGGKIVENLVQAFARDLLKYGMIAAHEFGFYLFLHVHDELAALQKIGDKRYTAANLRMCMVEKVKERCAWARDIPYDASPDTFAFYRK